MSESGSTIENTPTSSVPAPQDRVMQGVFHVATAFFLFTVMQACAKLLTGRHSVIEIAFYRNFISLIPLAVYILATRRFELLKTDMPGTLSLRVIIGTVGLIVTFYTVQYLPLAEATVLFFTAALIMPVLSIILLKETIGWRRWMAIFIGFGGVLLVAGPSGQITGIGLFFGLTAAFIHATIQVLIRKMRQVPAFTITFYFFLGGIILPGLAMPWVAHMPSFYDSVLLLAIGIIGGGGQYFLTTGFQKAPASTLSPLTYTGIIWATGLDILIWSYVPGWPVYAGALLIIGANLYIMHRERIAARKKEAA